MATEPQSFHLRIDADARLAAAVGGVARYLADAARMENGAIARLQSSVVAACLEVFGHLTAGHPHLEATLTRFADRIEVVLSHQGEALPAVGLDSIAGFAAQAGGGEASKGAFAGFDRVQYETHGGKTVTRLTKYIGKITPIA